MSEAVNPDVQPVKIFSAQGRIGRVRYLAYTFAANLLFILAAGGMSLLLGTVVMSVVYVAMLGYVVFVALMTIQRGHDLGWRGWTAIFAFIPIVGLIWLVLPGAAGSNRYGPPTPPNTWLVIIGGLLIPGIAAIGMLAAIALPAYQGYVERAKAAQVLKP